MATHPSTPLFDPKLGGSDRAFMPLIPTFLASLLGTLIAQLFLKTNALQFLPLFLIGLTAAQLQLGQDLLNKIRLKI